VGELLFEHGEHFALGVFFAEVADALQLVFHALGVLVELLAALGDDLLGFFLFGDDGVLLGFELGVADAQVFFLGGEGVELLFELVFTLGEAAFFLGELVAGGFAFFFEAGAALADGGLCVEVGLLEQVGGFGFGGVDGGFGGALGVGFGLAGAAAAGDDGDDVARTSGEQAGDGERGGTEAAGLVALGEQRLQVQEGVEKCHRGGPLGAVRAGTGRGGRGTPGDSAGWGAGGRAGGGADARASASACGDGDQAGLNRVGRCVSREVKRAWGPRGRSVAGLAGRGCGMRGRVSRRGVRVGDARPCGEGQRT